MRAIARTLAALAAAGLILAAPAAAAPPPNDTSSNAVAITLPYTQTLDTTEATTDADDAQVNASCGAPATDASVWYVYTAATSGDVAVDVSASDYNAGAIVATGSPGSLTTIACAPGVVGFSAVAGTTYHILVFDDSAAPPNGGTLVLSVDEAQPPEVSVTVDPDATFNRQTGSLMLTGTYTCSDAEFAFLDVSASQRVGRFTVNGFGGMELECDGATHPWSLELTGSNGRFAGGKATVRAFTFACGAFECSEDEVVQTVRVRGR